MFQRAAHVASVGVAFDRGDLGLQRGGYVPAARFISSIGARCFNVLFMLHRAFHVEGSWRAWRMDNARTAVFALWARYLLDMVQNTHSERLKRGV